MVAILGGILVGTRLISDSPTPPTPTVFNAPDLLFAIVLGLTSLTVMALVLTGLIAAIRKRRNSLLPAPHSSEEMPLRDA